MTKPSSISSVQWDQALGLARQSCARVFRDGGSPADAIGAFGLTGRSGRLDWDRAIDCIAQCLCAGPR